MAEYEFWMLTTNEKLNWLYDKVCELEHSINEQNVSVVLDKIAILEKKIDQLLEG